MSPSNVVSRRTFLQSATMASFAGIVRGFATPALAFPSDSSVAVQSPLVEFGYGDVAIHSALHEEQLQQTHAVLMDLNDDALLKPFRMMAGQAAPGEDLGGWYRYDPAYDWHTFDAGFAPSATFGQWVSALARVYAITGSQAVREKVLRSNRLYAQ